MAGVLGFVRRDSGSGVMTKDALWVWLLCTNCDPTPSRVATAACLFDLFVESELWCSEIGPLGKAEKAERLVDGGRVGFLLVGPIRMLLVESISDFTNACQIRCFLAKYGIS